MDFNIFYGMYGYEKVHEFTPLVDQCCVEYMKEEKTKNDLNNTKSYISQEMLNPQLDLDVPKCKCQRQ